MSRSSVSLDASHWARKLNKEAIMCDSGGFLFLEYDLRRKDGFKTRVILKQVRAAQSSRGCETEMLMVFEGQKDREDGSLQVQRMEAVDGKRETEREGEKEKEKESLVGALRLKSGLELVYCPDIKARWPKLPCV